MIDQVHLTFSTQGRGAYPITDAIANTLPQQQGAGLCHLFLQHTSASLILCENADPDVLRDLEVFLGDWVKDGDSRFVHTMEGADDMPAHIRTVLTQNHMSIPFSNGRLQLGTWQGVFLYEHRWHPHHRNLVVTHVYA